MWSPQNRMRMYIVGIRRDVQLQPFEFPTSSQQRSCTLGNVLQPDNDKIPPHCYEMTDHMIDVVDCHAERIGPNFHRQNWIVNAGSSLSHGSCIRDCSCCITRRSRPYLSTKDRKLSPLELQRIQGFPDCFQWGSTLITRQHCLLGNTMSVYVMVAIIRQVLTSIGYLSD